MLAGSDGTEKASLGDTVGMQFDRLKLTGELLDLIEAQRSDGMIDTGDGGAFCLVASLGQTGDVQLKYRVLTHLMTQLDQCRAIVSHCTLQPHQCTGAYRQSLLAEVCAPVFQAK